MFNRLCLHTGCLFQHCLLTLVRGSTQWYMVLWIEQWGRNFLSYYIVKARLNEVTLNSVSSRNSCSILRSLMFQSTRIFSTGICLSIFAIFLFLKFEYFCILGLVSIVRFVLNYKFFVCFVKVLKKSRNLRWLIQDGGFGYHDTAWHHVIIWC